MSKVLQDKTVTAHVKTFIEREFDGVERQALLFLNEVACSVPTDPAYRECVGTVAEAAAAVILTRQDMDNVLRSLEDRNMYYLDSDPERLGMLRLLPHPTHYLRPGSNNDIPGYRELLEYVRSTYDLEGIRRQWH